MECPICLELMPTNRVRTPCGHRFHRDCIMAELQHRQRCPLCRRAIQRPRPQNRTFELKTCILCQSYFVTNNRLDVCWACFQNLEQ